MFCYTNIYAIDFIRETKKFFNRDKGEYFEEINKTPLFSFSSLWDLLDKPPYVSPLLLSFTDVYSTELYNEEFKNLNKLFALSNNKYEKIFYLYQAILIVYKNGDYPEAAKLNGRIKDLGLPTNVLDLATNIAHKIEKLIDEEKDFKFRADQNVATQEFTQIQMDYSQALKTIGDEGFSNLFHLYLYAFQFGDAKTLLTKIKKSYLEKPELYDEWQYELEMFLRYFGDMTMPSMNLVHLIHKEDVTRDKLFDINKPDVTYLIAYGKDIERGQLYYKDLLVARIDLMERLLPFLYLTGFDERFRNLYEKVIFIKHEPPQNLELASTNYKVSQLKGIYTKVLKETVYNAYYELTNKFNIKTAEEYIRKIEDFDPANYIYNIDVYKSSM
jgi:hypothetical protein